MTDVGAFTIAGRDVWVAHLQSGRVDRIDPATGRAVGSAAPAAYPSPWPATTACSCPTAISYAARLRVGVDGAGLAGADRRAHGPAACGMLRTPSEDNSTTTDRRSTWVAEDLDGCRPCWRPTRDACEFT